MVTISDMLHKEIKPKENEGKYVEIKSKSYGEELAESFIHPKKMTEEDKKKKESYIETKPKWIQVGMKAGKGISFLRKQFIRERFKSKYPIKDRIKVLRYQNILEKRRLLNQIERFKLMRRVELLRRKGQLPQIPTISPLKPRLPIRYFADDTLNYDVASAFNADIGHGDNLWGNEKYFHDNDFYDENFFGNENFFDVGIDWGRGGNPLLW